MSDSKIYYCSKCSRVSDNGFLPICRACSRLTNTMTMHKKLQESMRKGVILERNRCMLILFKIAANTKEGLDKKLMTVGEKHLAELRFKIAEGLIAAAQMMVMSGEDSDAKTETTDLHGQDPDAVGQEQGDPDGRHSA